MKSTTLIYAAACSIALSSCNFSAENKSAVKTKPVTSKDNTTLNGTIIKNDIDLDATGVKLKEAYLVDADYKLLKENKARLGEKIYLVIKMDTGWVKENGKSFIGASEKILTTTGNVVVSAEDIFKDYEAKGIDAKDTKLITLSAVITQADPGANEFQVQFRVWDKKSSAEVKGKYYFTLNKD